MVIITHGHDVVVNFDKIWYDQIKYIIWAMAMLYIIKCNNLKTS